MNKEIILTIQDLQDIKSDAIPLWVTMNKGETDLVASVIHSFLMFCNRHKLIVQDGKILDKPNPEEDQQVK